ncbi:hypothetical protein BDF20DRAFT_815693 [Mycotypha africana]|uniref:uncharacterized protein n=1 Tax=Mycotypha africana TaxID=64632 RepID=UPI0023011E47|nr:uncharacterized protein BDF20DRAFT_815693 [Mycotypha africana]KAI8987950.1 hypothetical protein BDF20DRAFT_815693 [Mycotypha africana]
MPARPNVDSHAADYIVTNWYTKNKNYYGKADVTFVRDPLDSQNYTYTVLKVGYPKGSYAPIGTKKTSAVEGGVEFYSVPYAGYSFNTAYLSYDLMFDENFDWVKGGKLPGIYGGPPGEGCSGGEKATGENCFSVRLMWRNSGHGEAYAYIPTSDNLCKTKHVICNDDYGTSFSRGVIKFEKKKWTHIDLYVRLNSGNNENGILKVWQDGSLVINQQQLKFRSKDSVGVSALMFSTFFGGGSQSYATPVDTATYYKNIQFSTNDTIDPSTVSFAPSSLTISVWTSLYCTLATLLLSVLFS